MDRRRQRLTDADGQKMENRSQQRSHRGSIHLEEATILRHEAHAGGQHILRIEAPRAARSALPGMFAHLRCAPSIPMRRPLSVMRAEPAEGWLEFLYKPIGRGLAALTERRPGEQVSCLAPIGRGFSVHPERPRIIALGGGVGIPPMIFLAEQLREHAHYDVTVLMGSEIPFPFELVPASEALAGLPASATHEVALLRRWGVASRLASRAQLSGAFVGFVPELAELMLAALPQAALETTQLYACGPEAMLRATARLAQRFGVACEVALEEFMACGVGGCAGCTRRIETPTGPAMKRVCVDGPVFDASTVAW
jgi:dihydroorotate dehydrogenase electron transfer subunit